MICAGLKYCARDLFEKFTVIVLFNFVKAIRKRGYKVEITSIKPIVFEMLEDSQYHGYFSLKLV
jgi:anti-anti-sigma regulatory factor